MKNTTNKGAWAIKNTAIPLETLTTDENAPEILKITRAAERLGAEVDGYDIDGNGLIDGVSVTGPADAIEALVGLFTGDDPAGATTPLVIPTIDFFEAQNLVNALSENEGNDAAIIAIENWLDENAAAAAEDYARRGYADLAADILEIYGGEGDDDWADVTSAIDAARSAEEEPDDAEEAALDASETAALDAVTMYLGDEGNEPLREAIEVAAENCKRDANDIFAAGRFEGAAAMLAAQIWATGASHGATRAQMIEATYRAYGLPW